MSRLLPAVSVSAVLLLSACGGGGAAAPASSPAAVSPAVSSAAGDAVVKVTKCALRPDSGGYIVVAADLTNTTKARADVIAQVEIVDKAGTRIDEATVVAAKVAPGQMVKGEGGSINDKHTAGFTCRVMDVTVQPST